MHYLEAWNEALCDGAWGPVGARLGEKFRQGLDLEHWAAFGESLERMMGIVRAVGTGERGEPPASIVALSGDVHHAYLAEVAFPKGTGMRSTAWQATCSPFRNPLDNKERTVMRFMASAPARVIMRGAGEGGRRRGSLGALALCPRRAVVRQPGRHARARRPQRAARAREDGARPRTPSIRTLKLERVFERALS